MEEYTSRKIENCEKIIERMQDFVKLETVENCQECWLTEAMLCYANTENTYAPLVVSEMFWRKRGMQEMA